MSLSVHKSGSIGASPRKLRILCFHGYLQNAKEFAGKVGSLRKGLKSRAELIFIDAPHHVEQQQSISDTAIQDPRGWWTWQDPDVIGRPSLASSYAGVEESLQVAENAMAENEPIDGFLGFSQGAALASLLLAQCQHRQQTDGLKFAILAGAFLPKDPQYAQFMTTAAVSIPTLFISGTKDQYIPPERTDRLIETFDPKCVERYTHNGGHLMPTCTGEFKQCLQAFLDKHGATQL